MDAEEDQYAPWWKKLAWLVLIWCAGVAALGAVAYLLRVVMRLVGLGR